MRGDVAEDVDVCRAELHHHEVRNVNGFIDRGINIAPGLQRARAQVDKAARKDGRAFAYRDGRRFLRFNKVETKLQRFASQFILDNGDGGIQRLRVQRLGHENDVFTGNLAAHLNLRGDNKHVQAVRLQRLNGEAVFPGALRRCNQQVGEEAVARDGDREGDLDVRIRGEYVVGEGLNREVRLRAGQFDAGLVVQKVGDGFDAAHGNFQRLTQRQRRRHGVFVGEMAEDVVKHLNFGLRLQMELGKAAGDTVFHIRHLGQLASEMHAVEVRARVNAHVRAEKVVVSGGGIHGDGVVARAAGDDDMTAFNHRIQLFLRKVDHGFDGLAAIEHAHAAGNVDFIRTVAQVDVHIRSAQVEFKAICYIRVGVGIAGSLLASAESQSVDDFHIRHVVARTGMHSNLGALAFAGSGNAVFLDLRDRVIDKLLKALLRCNALRVARAAGSNVFNDLGDNDILNSLGIDAHLHGRLLFDGEIHCVVPVAGIDSHFADAVDINVHIIVFPRAIVGKAVGIGGADLAVHANVDARQQRVKTVEDKVALNDGLAVGIRSRSRITIFVRFHGVFGNDGNIGDGGFSAAGNAERLQQLRAQRIFVACPKINAPLIGTRTDGDDDIDNTARGFGQVGFEMIHRTEQGVANCVVGCIIGVHGTFDADTVDRQHSASSIDGIVFFRFRLALVYRRHALRRGFASLWSSER